MLAVSCVQHCFTAQNIYYVFIAMYVFVYSYVAQETGTSLMWVFEYNLVFEITNPDQR